MKAGRELDALVAEKVMGIERNADGLFFVGHARWRESTSDEWRQGGPGHGQPRPYSTSIAAAWQVVEKMGGHVHLMRFGATEPMMWRANFTVPVERRGEADTAPLAICLAALKTVESE